jgi:trehalose 6-phosphate synthase/phosphatase
LLRILVRFVAPTLIAISILAFVGVPVANRMLDGWFRADINLRAQLVANSMAGTLSNFVTHPDDKSLREYLANITTDERLLAVLICADDDHLIFKTERTPPEVSCSTTREVATGKSQALDLTSGPVEVSAFRYPIPPDRNFRTVIVHDLNFINRRQSAARSYVIAFGGIVASLLAMIVGFVFWLLLRRWVSNLLGDIRALRFLDDAKSESPLRPILTQVRNALREVEISQRLEIDFSENWTPPALRQVVKDHLRSPEMYIVSNREPYIHNESPDGVQVQVPASGMVTALEPIMRACAGKWIAHGSGSADKQVVDHFDHVSVPPDDPSYTLRRVWLSAEEEEGFYYGFSNEGLWPLCHLAYVRPAFRESDWRQYEAVNRRFADVVAQESKSEDPVVLIQDYHFALLPRLLRLAKPKATIALFWHIPWPNSETFGVCPWKAEMLSHMLAADIVGFHTRYHCQNFLDTADRYVECQINHEQMTVTLRGHVCRVVPYPISIEWPPRWLKQLPRIPDSRANVRARYGIGQQVSLGVGVERWDFTKGIVERMQALEILFEKYPAYIGKVSLLQVAAPSRSKLPAYRVLQESTLQAVNHLNEKFRTSDWVPVVLIEHHQEPREVFELFQAADFCIVNSLHDGMNLVAKEFIAAREDDDGVLILSTFAGASRELPEAILINPFDIAETAAAIKLAMNMSREERRTRMNMMRRTVKEKNVYRWAGRMLMDVARIRQRQSLTNENLRL